MGHSNFETTRRYIADDVLMAKVQDDIINRMYGKPGQRQEVHSTKIVTEVITHKFSQ